MATPRMTRTFTLEVDEEEGVVRVLCRTKVMHLTPRALGRIITEFMYQRGALPLVRQEPEPEADCYE